MPAPHSQVWGAILEGARRSGQMRRAVIGAAVWLCCAMLTATQAQAPTVPVVIAVDHGANSAAQQARHYVILVSLDGFRYDYAAKFGAPNLEHLPRKEQARPRE